MTPTVQKFAVRRDDGSVMILGFITRGRGNSLPSGATWEDERSGIWLREPSVGNVLSEIARLARIPGAPQPIGYRAISDADIPADRTYRNAWTDDGSVIRHDMPKARDLHIQRVRRARGLRLEDLDAKWMRASGQKKQNEADEIESQRQTLRDLPMTLKVEEAQTIEDLKGKWSPLLDGV